MKKTNVILIMISLLGLWTLSCVKENENEILKEPFVHLGKNKKLFIELKKFVYLFI